MSDEEHVEEAINEEIAESSPDEELLTFDQADAIVKIVEAGYLEQLDPSQYVDVSLTEDVSPKLAKRLAVAGAAADLAAAWGKSNLVVILNGSVDELRAAKDGIGLIPRFLGDGNKVVALARLEKVALDPTEVADALLGVAAAYVQAQYMEDIDQRLISIEHDLKLVKGILHDQRMSKVESSYNQLTSFYIPNLSAYLEDDSKLIPARTQVLAIVKELNDCWAEQVHATKTLSEKVLAESKPDEGKLKTLIAELEMDDRAAAAIFGTLCIADQARMLYNQELSSDQIALVESQEKGLLANYLALRSIIVKRLDEDIEKVRRPKLAFPAPLDEQYAEEPRGVFERVGRAVDAFGRRALSDSPWGAAEKQAEDYRAEFKGSFPHDQESEVPCGILAAENHKNLHLIDVALNQANEIAVSEDKIFFLINGGEENEEEMVKPVEDSVPDETVA